MQRPQPVAAFALSSASLHLRNTHFRSHVNLLNFPAPIRRIHSYLTFAHNACRHPTGSRRPAHWLLDARLCVVQFNLPNRLTITPVHAGTHVVMSGETHLDFTANSNGYESPAPGISVQSNRAAQD